MSIPPQLETWLSMHSRYSRSGLTQVRWSPSVPTGARSAHAIKTIKRSCARTHASTHTHTHTHNTHNAHAPTTHTPTQHTHTHMKADLCTYTERRLIHFARIQYHAAGCSSAKVEVIPRTICALVIYSFHATIAICAASANALSRGQRAGGRCRGGEGGDLEYIKVIRQGV